MIRTSPRRGGFTLIEMVLVLIILATIAGLVISQLSMLGRTSDMAATAKNQQDIANQLSLYFVLQKRMPQRLDSLLQTGATPAVMPALTRTGATGASSTNQGWGFPLGGSQGSDLVENLTAVDLRATGAPAGARRSLTRLGLDVVMDHQAWAAGANCSDSGNVARTLDDGTNCWVARVLTTTNGDTLPTGSGVIPIVQRIYPTLGGALPDGVTALVAVGVGPNSSLVPDTMLNAPIYPGCDGSYYGRYIAYFACFATGERAQLVGVSDSYGRFPGYSQQQFVESLPNNGRQG